MNARENYLRAIHRQFPAYVPDGSAVKTIIPPIVERPDRAGKDCFGVLWEYAEETGGGTYPAEHDFVITELAHWRTQVVFPDVHSLDWARFEEKAAAVDRTQYVLGSFSEMGIFERIYLLMGMENALCAFLTDPDEMAALADAIADYKVSLLDEMCSRVQPDMIWYGDDWGTQTNLFLPPEIWRKVIKPGTQKIYDCMKKHGVFINQHSCGKIEQIFEDIVEMGAQMWNPCQPCNDLTQLKKRFGERISFCGGIDSQFVLDNPNVGPDGVDREVRQKIQDLNAPYGGYVAAPSHSVPYDPDKLSAMRHAIEHYGRIR